MKLTRVVCGVAALAALALADEPWNKREFQSWTQEEARKILNDSPWGKVVATRVEYVKDADISHETDRGSKRMERGDPRGSDFATVVWWSARTPRRAFLRLFQLSGNELKPEQIEQFAEAAKPNLQIALFGGGRMVDISGKLTLEELRQGAWLDHPRLKQRIAPVNVEVVKSGQRVDRIIFEFPRELNGQPVVADDEKRIVFKWKLPKTDKETLKNAEQFEAVFDARKMRAAGQADL